MSEATWTFDSKLRQLDTKLTEATQTMDNKLDRTVLVINSAVQVIKKDVMKELNEHVATVNKLNEDIRTHVNACTQDMKEVRNLIEDRFTIQDQKQNKREILLNNHVESLREKIDKVHFNIIDNEDNVSFTYTNPDGYMEYGAVRKFVPDEKTITTIDKKIALKYSFDNKDFKIKDNKISVTGISLQNGKHVTADLINNNLNNATYNIEALSQKVTNILNKLYTFNGYVASNNFKKATPTEEQLYNFAINCLSTSGKAVTKEQVPSATKIKNTFDNHIWVLNRVTVDGLTTSKWEDFGSDTVCIASNDGVHGLVTGSQERYMGYIDLQGRISINGLEEDLTDILGSIQNINDDLTNIQTEFSAKLNDIEERLRRLEA